MVEDLTTAPEAQNLIIADIKAALEEKARQLREVPGLCEKCPEGPCYCCELRGCLALLKRLQSKGRVAGDAHD
jgi:hypothetical protein